MAEQGGASGGVSFTSSWGKDLSDSARQRYLESMMQGIMEMGMEGQNSDVEIIVEGQSFPCHKLLLSAGTVNRCKLYSTFILIMVTLHHFKDQFIPACYTEQRQWIYRPVVACHRKNYVTMTEFYKY
jgi:hypothetical protein